MNDLQNLVATILGSLLVLVAIWLIAVRRDSGRNQIKTPLGELDLSTPGLAVLVVGVGLLLAPAFLPHRPGGLPSFRWNEAPSADDPRPQPRPVLTSEEEPNDRADSPNVIEMARTAAGRIGEKQDELDYFEFYPAPEDQERKRIILRTNGTFGCCTYLAVWDEKEQEIARGQAITGETISVVAPPAKTYLIRVSANRGMVLDYELVVRQEPE